jgi:hypothetical protein
MSKTCDKMGFTEKASCRPYKNCYKKGGKSKTVKNAKGRSRSSRRSSHSRNSRSGNVNPAKEHAHKPEFVYHSEHTTFTSHPETGTPYGKRTVVNVENGKGVKALETLNSNGKVVKTQSHEMTKAELAAVKEGNYVPGLWSMFSHAV